MFRTIELFNQRAIALPDGCERIVLCEACQSEGRILTSDGGPYDTDNGECPYCEGTGGEIVKTEPITLEDLELLDEEMDQ